MDTFEAIIEAAGGPAALSRRLAARARVRLSRQAVAQWAKNGSIPAPYWSALIEDARDWTPPRTLSAEHLTAIASRALERRA